MMIKREQIRITCLQLAIDTLVRLYTLDKTVGDNQIVSLAEAYEAYIIKGD